MYADESAVGQTFFVCLDSDNPDAETLLGDMSAHLGEEDVHPRILADADDFASFAASVQKDARHKTLLNKLKQTYGVGAAEYLAAPLTYQLARDRLLNVSSQAFWRIGSWATLYRATGDERYAERAWRELEAVCAFADWHPDHFLDTGVMCAAVAIGYDWLYDFLTPERRKTVEEALPEKGLRLGLDVYEGRRGIWGDNNWSGVCNGGLTAAAALAGVYPEEWGRLISFCLTGVERGIKPVSFFDVFFYDADNVSPSLSLPLDAYYSNVGAVTMRSTWEDRATFVGLCGGSNSVAHGDLDIGNFVIDVDGCRFLDDLGSDNYGLPGYFVASRWTYYRKRAEGQNTLVIGAVSRNTPDQAPTANGRFTRVESSASSSIAVVDMAAAYTQVTDGQRGIFFRDNRTTIVVQDEIRLDTPEIVRWQVHTRGRIAVSADGRTAVITDNGHRLYCEIVAQDSSLRFTTRAAESYDPYYKDTEGEYDRSYLTRLCIISGEVTDFTCAVAFRVLKSGEAAPEAGTLYRLVPMRDWKLEL
ncbi:MAG: heparinase II/III family protein [Eubacteriales bacterium]